MNAQVKATPGGAEQVAPIREGKGTIGETDAERGQSIVVPDGREVKVMGGYDALATALLRGEGCVKATCFHRGEKMEIQIENGELVRASHPSILFWLGDGPKGIPVCDHYNSTRIGNTWKDGSRRTPRNSAYPSPWRRPWNS